MGEGEGVWGYRSIPGKPGLSKISQGEHNSRGKGNTYWSDELRVVFQSMEFGDPMVDHHTTH